MLRGVVEQLFLLRILEGGFDHLFQTPVLETGALDQLIGGFDIGLVMLVVMELQRLSGHVRLESIIGKRKFGKFERHNGLLNG